MTWCTYPLPGIEWSDRYLLVVTSSVGRLNIGLDGNNARGPLGGGNVFQNPQMLAVFPISCRVISYGRATVKELNE